MRSTEVPIRETESMHCSESPFEPFKHVPRPHPDKWGNQVATYRKWPSAPGTHVCSASHSWLLGLVPAGILLATQPPPQRSHPRPFDLEGWVVRGAKCTTTVQMGRRSSNSRVPATLLPGG